MIILRRLLLTLCQINVKEDMKTLYEFPFNFSEKKKKKIYIY